MHDFERKDRSENGDSRSLKTSVQMAVKWTSKGRLMGEGWGWGIGNMNGKQQESDLGKGRNGFKFQTFQV